MVAIQPPPRGPTLRTFTDFAELEAAVGEELGTTEWMEVTQERVNLFADATDEELARFTLTFSVTETGAVLAVLRRTASSSGPSGWTLQAVGEGVPITVPTQGLAKLTRFVR